MMCRILALLLTIMFPLAGAADDSFVYESFSGVKIGRVFLSQSQRETLDARRLLGPQEGGASGEQSVDPASGPRRLPSAGFIIGRNGHSKIWRDGDFVDSGGAARSMTFPGDVRITRHVAADPSSADTDLDATSVGDSGDDGG